MNTSAATLPIAPTVAAPGGAVQSAPVRTRQSATPPAWSGADEFDAEKGTMGGYAQPASEDLSFGDLIDLINPLQHIPGVSHVYRAMTGDTIKPAVKVAGGMLFGGPVGMLLGAGGAVVDSMLGDPVAQVADAVLGTDSAQRPRVAAASSAAEPPADQVAAAASSIGSAASLPGAGTQVAALADPPRAAVPATPAAAGAASGSETEAGSAETIPAGPTDIGSAGEATLAALIAASQARSPTTAPQAAAQTVPQGGFDLAAYAGGRPAAAAAAPARAAGGKSIRTYFDEAPPRAAVVRRPAAASPKPEAAGAAAASAEPGADTASKAKPGTTRNDVAALPDKPAPAVRAAESASGKASTPGVQMPNQGSVPPWFADRVLQNLDRYGAGRKDEAKGGPASG